jgi:hypothetical protein
MKDNTKNDVVETKESAKKTTTAHKPVSKMKSNIQAFITDMKDFKDLAKNINANYKDNAVESKTDFHQGKNPQIIMYHEKDPPSTQNTDHEKEKVQNMKDQIDKLMSEKVALEKDKDILDMQKQIHKLKSDNIALEKEKEINLNASSSRNIIKTEIILTNPISERISRPTSPQNGMIMLNEKYTVIEETFARESGNSVIKVRAKNGKYFALKKYSHKEKQENEFGILMFIQNLPDYKYW